MPEPQSIACDESGLRRAGSLHRRLWAWAVKNCVPLGASIEITLVCNLRCPHCYNFDRAVPYPKERRGAELTSAEILGVIDQLSDEGCRFLSITGGEALLNPHLDDFIRHARKRRMIVQVKSNGVLLTEDRVRGLAEAGANGVDVSLYGATPQTHDAFTLLPGSFAKALDGIRHTRAAGLDCILNMCIVRGNAAEVAQMIELAESLVGTNYGINPFISARYDGTTSSMDQRVSRETLEQLYRGPLRHFMPEPDFNPNRSVQCACARANCGVTATGDVYPCINAPVLSGNIREDSFHNIWWNSPQFKRIRGLKLDDFPACKPCPDRPYCSRSSGAVYSDTGHYTGAEEFICMDAGIKHMLHLEKLAIADE